MHADDGIDHAQVQEAESIVHQRLHRLLPYPLSTYLRSYIHAYRCLAVAGIEVEQVD